MSVFVYKRETKCHSVHLTALEWWFRHMECVQIWESSQVSTACTGAAQYIVSTMWSYAIFTMQDV